MNPTSLPKNKFLELTLLKMIESGNYRPHDRFLTVAELKSRFDASQATVIQALEKLEADGILYRRSRSGIFISPTSKVRQILVVTPSNRVASDELNRFSYGLGESKAAVEAGLVVINCTVEDFEKSAASLKIIYKKLAAVVFFRCGRVFDRYRELLTENGIFGIFYGSSSVGRQFPECNQFCYEERDLVFRALDVLYARGHREIACLSIAGEVFEERARCYIDWMIEKGLPVRKERIYTVAEGEDGYAHMLAEYRQRRPDYTAIFCASNFNLGTGAVQALRYANFKVPEEVAVLGIGDIQAGQLIRPRLAAMEIDFFGDAAKLIELFKRGVDPAGPPQRLGSSEFILKTGDSI